MYKLLSFAFVAISFSAVNIYTQTFTFVRTSPAMVYNSADSTIVSEGMVTVTASSITLICKKYKFLPPAWTVSYCFSLCYPPFVDSTHEHFTQGQQPFTMDFYPMDSVNIGHPGTGYAAMVMYDSLHPNFKDSIVFGATAWPIGIKIISSSVSEFKLNQNFPNPFNPSTKINFSIPRNEFADLRVYDLLGREVSVLVSGYINAGKYEVEFDAKQYASGMYYYRLKTQDNVSVKKMTLVK
jgi:hypothetical protein